MVFALIAYNCKRPLSFRSFVTVVTGKDRIWLTILLHIFCGYAVASGVSNSMAAGMMQISGGLNSIFGLSQNDKVYLFIAVLWVHFLSCLTGINKGLTYVSGACMFCFFGMITYNIALAEYDQWANEWPITFWNSFFIYAPIMGMFLARMGKGRTVRELF